MLECVNNFTNMYDLCVLVLTLELFTSSVLFLEFEIINITGKFLQHPHNVSIRTGRAVLRLYIAIK